MKHAALRGTCVKGFSPQDFGFWVEGLVYPIWLLQYQPMAAGVVPGPTPSEQKKNPKKKTQMVNMDTGRKTQAGKMRPS